MVLLIAVIVATAFWAALPVKLVALSGVVYVLVAGIKKIFPALGGWQAVAINVALSVAGVLMVAKPGDLADPTFWASLMMTAAAAAGIHGTVRSATKDEPAKNTDVTGTVQVQDDVKASFSNEAAVKNILSLMLVGVLMGSMLGCKPAAAGTPGTAPALPAGAVDQTDATAYQTLKPAHDFAASVSADVQSGKVTLTDSQKLALESLNRALNVADTAEQTYHNAGGGNAAALNTAISATLQAWASAQAALAQFSTK